MKRLSAAQYVSSHAFTFAEVCMAMVICVVFGMAAFATNQRLLLALKNQKETTIVTSALQWRMESFRATAFSNIADHTYVKDNILKIRTATNSSGQTIDPFAQLGSVSEQFTIGVFPDDGSTPTVLLWDAQHTNGHTVSNNNNLGNATLLKIDILISWTGADGRARSRQISTIAGIGNIGS